MSCKSWACLFPGCITILRTSSFKEPSSGWPAFGPGKKPPRLHRVEVSKHHNGNYRVNIWELPEPTKNLAVTVSARIRSSYYLKVSDTGEIINSNPPLAKLGFPD
ncbi:MAG: hypothetical protein ABSG53_21150 [Thermoguttaceae bacterium]